MLNSEWILKDTEMLKNTLFLTCLVIVALTAGCVERKLTINTNPQGALVELNDEQIGVTPVTVAFNWYGDYKVRIQKEGFNSIDTHRQLDRPLHDKFPFDFFASISPDQIVDEYEWTFDLETYKPITREELIEASKAAQEQANIPMDAEMQDLYKEMGEK